MFVSILFVAHLADCNLGDWIHRVKFTLFVCKRDKFVTSCLPFSFGAHQVISKTLFDMYY